MLNERVERVVRELLIAIGENPDRPGLDATPRRVAGMYAELLCGTERDAARIVRESGIPACDVGLSGPVMLRGIRFRAVCEEHLLPFAGRAHLAYLPGSTVAGLSALPRMLEVLASRLQTPTALCADAAETLWTALDARGALAVLEVTEACAARHPTACSRSVAARGAFTDAAARDEAIALLGVG